MAEPEAAEPDAPARAAAPVAPAERLLLLDVLRGFAVFGILVVNMLFFAGPFEWAVDPPWTSAADRAAGFVITTLFSGKFYSIFSILFGAGFAMQMERGEGRGAPAGRIFARRLVVLLATGLLHAAFVWYGDILHLYAVLGFLLLLFRRAAIEKIVPAVAIALMIPPGLAAVAAIGASLAGGTGNEHAAAEMFRTSAALRAYANGTWSEVTRHRIADWLMLDTFAVFFAPSVFAMMLTGLAAARARVFQDPQRHAALFRRALLIAIVPGIAGNLFIAAAKDAMDPARPTMLGAAVTAVQAIAVPALAIVYISAIALIAASGRNFLKALAPVGRMALTNYLLQSAIATLIFYSYGLGLFGKVGPAATTGLAVVIFALQIAISGWWMKRFRFGPVEWAWRSLTYGRWQPMRVPGD
ncbi:MAG TPA: DUF418 domain-containing protein [Thermoanaerobaculia bacterium]